MIWHRPFLVLTTLVTLVVASSVCNADENKIPKARGVAPTSGPAEAAVQWVGVAPTKIMGDEVPVLERLAAKGLKLRVTVDPKFSNIPLLF